MYMYMYTVCMYMYTVYTCTCTCILYVCMWCVQLIALNLLPVNVFINKVVATLSQLCASNLSTTLWPLAMESIVAYCVPYYSTCISEVHYLSLGDIKPNCEIRRACTGNTAEVTCFSESCTAIQSGLPVRMCRDCHVMLHEELDDPQHIYQSMCVHAILKFSWVRVLYLRHKLYHYNFCILIIWNIFFPFKIHYYFINFFLFFFN